MNTDHEDEPLEWDEDYDSGDENPEDEVDAEVDLDDDDGLDYLDDQYDEPTQPRHIPKPLDY